MNVFYGLRIAQNRMKEGKTETPICLFTNGGMTHPG